MPRLITFIACLALVAGCASPAPAAPATPTINPPLVTSSTVISTSTSTSSAPAPTGGATTVAGLANGQTATLSTVDVTVLQRKMGTFGTDKVAVIQAKLCLHADQPATPITYARWYAEDDNSGRFTATEISGDQAFAPSYPSGLDEASSTVQPGKCRTGWIVFQSGSATLTEVGYLNKLGEQATWKW